MQRARLRGHRHRPVQPRAWPASPTPSTLDGVFLEARPEFDWHPGMLLDDATLQVPFMADLVTMADPTSRVQLPELPQGHRPALLLLHPRVASTRCAGSTTTTAAGPPTASPRCASASTSTRVEHDGERLRRHTATGRDLARPPAGPRRRHQPRRPAAASDAGDAARVLHSADYLEHRDAPARAGSVTVVGSGQSAAEVYADLLATLDPRPARSTGSPGRRGSSRWSTPSSPSR